jgi:hypothetical protein
MMSIILLLIGVAAGVLLTFSTLVYLSKRDEKKLKKKHSDIFTNVLIQLTSNSVEFTSRINNTVQLNTKIDIEGDVQIMYFLDRQDISIFRDGDCIYTSNLIEKELIEKILKTIWSKFSIQINDVVQLMSNTFDKRTFMVISGISNPGVQETTTDDIQYNLDDILDKINEVGYNNLTESEKEFLKNLNK